MSDKFWRGVRDTLLIAVVFWGGLFWAIDAWGDDDYRDDPGDITNTLTGGDVSVVGGDTNVTGGDVDIAGDKSTAYGFSHALGDVDIRDCVASTQWGTILVSRQKIVLNQWCAAAEHLQLGHYKMAALHFCNVPETLAEFDNEAACETAHDFTPPNNPKPEPEPEAVVLHDEYYRQQVIYEEQIAQLIERVETIEEKPAPRPRVVQATEPPEFLSMSKRAALQAILDEDEDE